MKFKVGDTVYVKKRLMEGVITGKRGGLYPLVVLCEGQVLHLEADDVELVEEEKEMTYEEGKWYMWGGGACPLHPKDVVLVKTFNTKDGIGETWLHQQTAESWLHDPLYVKVFAFKITKKYVPPVAKEMTVEEISKALGYDVKIVKG